MIDKSDITGLILAGGRGRRMGGVDKGLQDYRGMPLAAHALLRLSPQVGRAVINANRNLDAYQAMGAPVWPDTLPGFPGPLAGLAVGLERCATPYLATVPCDCPRFPDNLVERLSRALAAHDADIAMAVTRQDGAPRTQPMFCLLKTSLLPSLLAFLQSGQRKVEAWMARHRRAEVHFEDALAFAGANTPAELQHLQP